MYWYATRKFISSYSNEHLRLILTFSRLLYLYAGNNYVMMSGRVILAKVLRKYRLTTDVKPEDVRIVMNFLLRSKNGFPVRLHRRSR